MNQVSLLRRAWQLATLSLALHPLAVLAAETVAPPVRLIVPFSAGGTADVLARLVAEKLPPGVAPQGAFVENLVGACGGVGANAVYKAPADGFTLLISSPGPIAINQGLYQKLPYDPSRWAPVAVLASVPNALIVSNNLPVKSAQEFATYAKTHPDRVTYASQGNGTTSHLTAKLFESLTGTRMVHIPYKGDTPALTDLAGGQVDAFFGNIGAAMPLFKAGRVRILAVTDTHRAATLPGVPTFVEAGLPGMLSVTWYAVVAPPGTPETRREALNTFLSASTGASEVRRRLAELGLEPQAFSLQETARFIAEETRRWQRVIREADVKLE